MSSVSRVGLALSLVFVFLFLALIAELYYLLWWKKRIIINSVDDKEDCNNSPRRGEFMCRTKSKTFLGSKALEPQRLCSAARMADTQVYEPQSLSYPNQNKNIWFRQFGEDVEVDDEDDDDDSYQLGPPRFLFTITEETREDLESEDGGGGGGSRKVSLSRRYSDLVLTIESTTPYLTPLASPTTYFTPPLTPSSTNGFNPLFESSSDVEIRRIKYSSPPPKFNFLKDAEEKPFRRQIMMNDYEMGVHEIGEEEETEMGIGKEYDMSRRVQFHGFSQCPSSSSSSQVLPVTTSPSSNKRTVYPSSANVQTNPIWTI